MNRTGHSHSDSSDRRSTLSSREIRAQRGEFGARVNPGAREELRPIVRALAEAEHDVAILDGQALCADGGSVFT